ncbi:MULTISPECIES: MBL fold metallo-hydrolase [Cyanophyceae]|uniref:MBL fold metallo-hydrolase n=1 Tax=Cyanophyceae TaxID=3028117 RepID=UPI001684C73D|nr:MULTISPECIES: MBL fold metallo-hydrolase [Cyanophyceae]MBD1914613.1 MBL fold metallo-hydrolase [Phormidium sp. FACHB-77]MBD2031008.1 MBL fold metallo-hydrolase [Phormidium sp. FACHB-322]MBD2052615.1 MBL fold metallo-hydrolase [Leptolyngbya sp. FACHB-60]
MAHLTARRPQNVDGDIYVDSSCIDCDTCRWMAPDIFSRDDEQSAVFHQPQTEAERLAALQAVLACPTASIGTVEPPKDMKAAQASFPISITENVYHCGYHSEKSYGAASYLIRRPEGNVLVDSPRFAAPLVKQLEALGGVRYLYLTHQDDVADHQQFHERFGCDRILHADDIGSGTASVEIQLKGTDSVELASDLTIIPVPGHTKGHTVLLYGDRVLFTGDHLAWSVRLHQLHAFRSVCWYSWPEQIKSMEKLAAYDFEWVLPGHGRRHHADKATMRQHMQKCLDWMKAQ